MPVPSFITGMALDAMAMFGMTWRRQLPIRLITRHNPGHGAKPLQPRMCDGRIMVPHSGLEAGVRLAVVRQIADRRPHR